MESIKLKFAFALDENNQFANNHFGEARKFRVYVFKNEKFECIEEMLNPFCNSNHHNIRKAQEITSLLKGKNIDVLVSTKFGTNIKNIHDHFVPALVKKDNVDEVLKVLKKNVDWIFDELQNRTTNHMLFKISSGIVKTPIE